MPEIAKEKNAAPTRSPKFPRQREPVLVLLRLRPVRPTGNIFQSRETLLGLMFQSRRIGPLKRCHSHLQRRLEILQIGTNDTFQIGLDRDHIGAFGHMREIVGSLPEVPSETDSTRTVMVSGKEG